MATQSKPSTQNLDGLEENVPESLHPLLEWILNNLKTILIAVAAILVVLAGYAVYENSVQNRMAADREALGKLIANPDAAAAISGLKEFAANGPSELRTDARFALAEKAVDSGDLDAAITAFGELTKNSDPTVRAVAGLGQANALINAEKPDEAVSVLSSLEGSAPEAFQPIIKDMLAVAAEAAGRWELALQKYQELQGMTLGEDVTGADYLSTRIKAMNARLAGETPAEGQAPAETPAEGEAPAETPAEAPAEAPAQTPAS